MSTLLALNMISSFNLLCLNYLTVKMEMIILPSALLLDVEGTCETIAQIGWSSGELTGAGAAR